MSDLKLRFDANDLVPVVVQDANTDVVLMMAFMNPDALHLTRETGEVHFWSRSRQSLWHKGETSGHVQKVRSIHVNCNQDSLLIKVEQIGACCHTGYETCYFREITAANELVTHGERIFDPDAVYTASRLTAIFRLWIGAYLWLQNHDLAEVSGTSRLLHSGAIDYLASRVSNELGELSGVLDGTHVHSGRREDFELEGSQVLYWLALTHLRSGAALSDLVERMISASQSNVADISSVVESVRRVQEDWAIANEPGPFPISSTLDAVSAAAQTLDLTLEHLVQYDLAALQTRSYLGEYFSSAKS